MSGPLSDRAILRIEGDPDGDGTIETGEFHMVGDLEILPGMRTGYIVDGQGSTVNSVITSVADAGESKREGVFIDLGGGAHTVEISFRGWEGAIDADGNYVQWGDDPSPGRSQTSATGKDAITQIDVLMQYLLTTEIDSRSPATLEYGERSQDGLYDPIEVVIEGPTFSKRPENGNSFEGSMTLVSAREVRQLAKDAADATEQLPDWITG